MAAIDAAGAYERGATGAGITVAVIDTGIDLAQPDLAGRISSLSTDVFPGRNQPDRGSRHGTRVAGMIAANFDGTGTVGVAYQSTILSIRADDTPTGACDATDGCSFEDRELTAAINYAVANGARIINMSLGGPTPDGPAFEAALKRAVDAGLVVTLSAGNDATPSPEWPARYAIDARYLGAVMAVGASNQSGDMADFSARAGIAANGFIVAPGDDVVTDCTSSGCWRISGTSFSSPIVAGALALLLQSFPMISGRDAVDILFRTATDKGAAGVDPIWGHGLLNLRAAFQPVGTLSVPTAAGDITPITVPSSQMSTAFGDAIRTTSALTTFGRDDYRRNFEVDLGEAFPSGAGGLLGAAPPPTRSTAVQMAGPGGSRLSVQAEQAVFPDSNIPERMLDFTGMRQPSSALVSAEFGRLSLSAWRGEGGATAPNAGDRDVFRAVAAPDQIVQAAWSLGGGFSIAAEQGSSERTDILAFREVEATTYSAATAGFARGRFALAVTGGAMDEPLGPLGSDLSQRTVFNLPAQTRFGAVALSARASDRLTLRVDAAFGRTRIEDGFLDTEGAMSSQWRLGAYGDCSLLGIACDSFALELEQPLRIENGTFTVLLADMPADWRDPVTFSTRRFSASPSGRELDLRLTLDRDFGGWGLFRLRTVAGFNDGHHADQGLSLGAALDWRVTF